MTACSSAEITYDDAEFRIGSLAVDFTMSALMEFDDETAGHLLALMYIHQDSGSQWQLQVTIPYDLWQSGTRVDFRKCIDDGLPCSAALIEARIRDAVISSAFVRAINYTDRRVGVENRFDIDEIWFSRDQESHGTLKLFFAEYTAELGLNKSGNDSGSQAFRLCGSADQK